MDALDFLRLGFLEDGVLLPRGEGLSARAHLEARRLRCDNCRSVDEVSRLVRLATTDEGERERTSSKHDGWHGLALLNVWPVGPGRVKITLNPGCREKTGPESGL